MQFTSFERQCYERSLYYFDTRSIFRRKHKLHETQDIDSLSREIKHTLLKTIKSPEYSANSKDAVSHLENEKIKVKGLESEALFGKFVQVDLDRIKTAINHLKYLIHFYVHVAVVS